MRLIDADALIEKFTNANASGINLALDRYAVKCIEDAQTIAQPEIVRCRDCCYWIPGLITDNDCFIPPKCGKYQRGKYQQMVGHSADDYCSYAERREVSE
jgi:hypothetical protein